MFQNSCCILVTLIWISFACAADRTSGASNHKDVVLAHEAHLEGVPAFLKQPEETYYAWKGKPADFECIAEPVSHAVVLCADKIFPYKGPDGNERLQVTRFDSQGRPNTEGRRWHIKLQIKAKEVEEWFGSFQCTCEVWNQIPQLKRVKKVLSNNATIIEAYLDRDFQLEPIPEQLAIGERLLLSCHPPKGIPSPKMNWLKNGIQIDASVLPRVVIDDYNQLSVENVQLDDAGNYTCVADTLGIEKRYATAQVLVKRKRSKTSSQTSNSKEVWGPWGICSSSDKPPGLCQQTRNRICVNSTLRDDWHQRPDGVEGSAMTPTRSAEVPCLPIMIERRNCSAVQCNLGFFEISKAILNGDPSLTESMPSGGSVNLRDIVFYTGLGIALVVLFATAHIVLRLVKRKPILFTGFRIRRSLDYGKQPVTVKNGNTTSTGNTIRLKTTLKPTLSNADQSNTFLMSDYSTASRGMSQNNTIVYPMSSDLSAHQHPTCSDTSLTGSAYSQPLYHQTENDLHAVNTQYHISNQLQHAPFQYCSVDQHVQLLPPNAIGPAHFSPRHGLMPPPAPSSSASAETYANPTMNFVQGSSSPGSFDQTGLVDCFSCSQTDRNPADSTLHFYSVAQTTGSNMTDCGCGSPDSGAIAWASVTGLGARICLPESDISLHIPNGALPSTSATNIYLAACRDEKYWPILSGNQTLLSSVIQFGPAGSNLLKPMVITFPHCAVVDQGAWVFSVHCFCGPSGVDCTALQTAGAGPNSEWTWREVSAIGHENPTDLLHCFIDGQRVHMITRTPMRFCLIGRGYSAISMVSWSPQMPNGCMTSSAECGSENNSGGSLATVTTAATGDTLPVAPPTPLTKGLFLIAFASRVTPTTTDCNLRVYAVLETADAVQHVKDTEKRLGGRLVDGPIAIHFKSDAGGLVFCIQELSSGWKSRAISQEIPGHHIWSGNHNTLLNCAFTLERIDQSLDGFFCSIYCHQDEAACARKILHVNITHSFEEVNLKAHTEGKGKDQQPNGLFRIPVYVTIQLCTLLEPITARGNDWRQLAQRLGLESLLPYFSTTPRPAETVLDVWEATRGQTGGLPELYNALQVLQRADCLQVLDSLRTTT